jgi:DNA polymerase sigma
LYDDEIHPLFLQIEALFKTLHFINPLFDSISNSYNIKYYGILVTDLFSYYSQSVNFEDFGIKMNKPITETLNEIV